MPYNPSTGVYSLPAIYLAVPGTVIIAAQHNTPLTDLQTAQNYPRPVIAGGTGSDNITAAATNLQVLSYGTAQVLAADEKLQLKVNVGNTRESLSANHLVTGDDIGKTLQFTATATVTFDPVADLGDGFSVDIWANTGVTLTLDPDGSETINGATSLIIWGGQKTSVWCDGPALFAKVTSDALSGPQLQGQITGLTLANNATDAINDIDIAVGSAAADTSPYYLMQLASALTKRMDAAWTVGNNQGGWLDGASMPDGTGHVFLIQRSDTGVVDVGASASLTPILPSNYDRKRRIGSIIRSAGAILAFFQDGDRFVLNVPSPDVNATNPGTSAVTRTLSVPLGLQVKAFGYTGIQTQTVPGAFVVYLSDLRQSDQSASDAVGQMVLRTPGTAGTYQSASYFQVVTSTSAQVRSRINVSNSNTILLISTHGWIDKRGRA